RDRRAAVPAIVPGQHGVRGAEVLDQAAPEERRDADSVRAEERRAPAFRAPEEDRAVGRLRGAGANLCGHLGSGGSAPGTALAAGGAVRAGGPGRTGGRTGAAGGSTMRNSTRRLAARPARFVLGAMGRVGPNPSATMRERRTPCRTRNSFT